MQLDFIPFFLLFTNKIMVKFTFSLAIVSKDFDNDEDKGEENV